MNSVTVLIDKLTTIERSLGVETDFTIRNLVIEAQDCALRMQREIAEVLLGESARNADQIESDLSLDLFLADSGWRRAFVAILPLADLSPLWGQ